MCQFSKGLERIVTLCECKQYPMSGMLSSAGLFLCPCEILIKNMSIKSTIAALAASPFLFAGAAFAGPYVNVESNLSYPDGDYSSAATDVHIGYEGGEGKVAYSTDDTETEFSGKVGISVAATDALGVYGELSGATNGEDSSGDNIVDWGAKIGAKFTF